MAKDWKDSLKQKGPGLLLIKLLILFGIIFLVDFVIGSLLQHFYFRQKSGMLYQMTYAMEQTKGEVIILGSSAARHNYDPKMLQDALHLSVYNAGMDGNSVFYSDAVLNCILKRYTPKMVILDFGYVELRKSQEDYDKLSGLLPYYKRHPEIRSIAELKSPYEKVKMLSRIYPYNSMAVSILTSVLQKGDGKPDLNGYDPLTTLWRDPMKDGSTFLNRELDSNKIHVYQSLIRDCIDKGIKLYVVCSPLFIRSNYTNLNVQAGQEIAAAHNVPFLDFSKSSAFLDRPEFFADISHLNEKGATYFTQAIIDSIGKELPQ